MEPSDPHYDFWCQDPHWGGFYRTLCRELRLKHFSLGDLMERAAIPETIEPNSGIVSLRCDSLLSADFLRKHADLIQMLASALLGQKVCVIIKTDEIGVPEWQYFRSDIPEPFSDAKLAGDEKLYLRVLNAALSFLLKQPGDLEVLEGWKKMAFRVAKQLRTRVGQQTAPPGRDDLIWAMAYAEWQSAQATVDEWYEREPEIHVLKICRILQWKLETDELVVRETTRGRSVGRPEEVDLKYRLVLLKAAQFLLQQRIGLDLKERCQGIIRRLEVGSPTPNSVGHDAPTISELQWARSYRQSGSAVSGDVQVSESFYDERYCLEECQKWSIVRKLEESGID